MLGLTVGAVGKAEAGLMLHSVDAQQLFGSMTTVRMELGTKAVDPIANFLDGQGNLDLVVSGLDDHNFVAFFRVVGFPTVRF